MVRQLTSTPQKHNSELSIKTGQVSTIGNITGVMKCPKRDFGIPMCYLSFMICSTLVLLQCLRTNKSSEEQLSI